MKDPKNTKQLLKQYHALPARVQECCYELPGLVEGFTFDVSVAYIFQVIEGLRRYTLYSLLVRNFNLDPVVVWASIDRLPVQDKEFWQYFQIALKFDVSNDLKVSLEDAKSTRNKAMHGQHFSEADARKCISHCLTFLERFSELVSKRAGFEPCGSQKGILSTGKGKKRLDATTTEWVLKGMKMAG